MCYPGICVGAGSNISCNCPSGFFLTSNSFPPKCQGNVKTHLKVFFIVLPKEGLAGWDPKKDWLAGAPQILLWVWYRLQNIIYEGSRVVIFYSRWHTKRRIGRAPPANPSFGMTMTKTLTCLRPVLSCAIVLSQTVSLLMLVALMWVLSSCAL